MIIDYFRSAGQCFFIKEEKNSESVRRRYKPALEDRSAKVDGVTGGCILDNEMSVAAQFAATETKPVDWPRWSGDGWWQGLEAASRAVLMLDYDGTLAPFVRDRLGAVLYAGVAERLLRLAKVPRLRMVLVSGRQARELVSLLPSGLRPEIWGSHGREHLLPEGDYEAAALTSSQCAALEWFDASVTESGAAGALEMKPGSRAIHIRDLSRKEERHLIDLVGSLFPQIKDAGFDSLPFDGGIEIRASGCSKATAVNDILSHEGDGIVAAYLGDDRTDEDAFHALDRRGLRVLVREANRPSAADLWLRPPDDLLAFLDRWLSAMPSADEAS